jgi:tRNA(Ile)-lysidine synthase
VKRSPSTVDRALAAALDARGGPRAGEHLLLAVSGGPDSTALLDGVAALAPARKWRLTAMHVDHRLRGEESAAEGHAVGRFAARLGVEFVERVAPIAPGRGLEARARRARYEALLAVAAEIGATCILTGHTRNDQVETVLLNLLRGAGRRGLGGIRPRRRMLLRPLLAVTRADVRRHLALRGLEASVDRSNADLAHARNRVRRLLVPWLETEFNPRLGEHVAALATRLRDEDALLTALAREREAALIAGDTLDVAVAAEPVALARRVVRSWLRRQCARTPAAEHVERVLALATGAGRGAVAVPGPGRVVRERDRLVHRLGREAQAERVTLAIAPGATAADPAGRWRLTLTSARAIAADELAGATPARAIFDADALPASLVVRSPVPGDRVHLAGVGTRKVQDVLTDAHVPREARPGVPLLVGGDTVLWVAGVVRASAASLGPATRRVVVGIVESDA